MVFRSELFRTLVQHHVTRYKAYHQTKTVHIDMATDTVISCEGKQCEWCERPATGFYTRAEHTLYFCKYHNERTEHQFTLLGYQPMKCKKHPTYKALREPRSGCDDCWTIYTSKKTKESQKRRPKS